MADTGSLRTLFNTLATNLGAGVSVSWGEESIVPQAQLPAVVLVPVGGPWDMNGYSKAVDQDINAVWMTSESIDVYCWAVDEATPGDALANYEAVEALRVLVLRALMQQQATSDGTTPARGLKWAPVSGQWVTAQDAIGRFGRAYKLTVAADITVTDAAPVDATIATVTLTANISH